MARHERAPRARMGRVEWLRVMWLGVGAVVWLGVFDYITSRAQKEYLYRNAELRLGIEPPAGTSADLREVLSRERKNGAIQGTAWAVFVIAAGWTTIALLSNRK